MTDPVGKKKTLAHPESLEIRHQDGAYYELTLYFSALENLKIAISYFGAFRQTEPSTFLENKVIENINIKCCSPNNKTMYVFYINLSFIVQCMYDNPTKYEYKQTVINIMERSLNKHTNQVPMYIHLNKKLICIIDNFPHK